MPDIDAAWNQAAPERDDRWRQFTASLPMRTALLAVATVWVLGAVWSFQEQSKFAAVKGFAFPHLLPLVIDGFAIAMAGVAWAASLDARPAVAARLATVIAVAASSASNGAWAYIRTNHDLVAVLLGVAVPVAANLAFEVLLAELRRQVQRRRGLPPPVAIPYPRLIRFALAPFRTFSEWRTLVLELTEIEHSVAPRRETADPAPAAARIRNVAAAPTSPAPARTATAPGTSLEPAPTAPTPTAPTPATPAPATPAPSAPAPSSPAPATPARSAPAPTSPTRATLNTANRVGAENPRPAPNTRPAPKARPAPTARPAADPTRSAARRRDLEMVPATPTNGSGPDRRAIDPRVEQLAQHLARTEDAGEFTGEMVGPLLKIDVAPRTGRRLLGAARDLVTERARAELGDGHDPELSVIGGR